MLVISPPEETEPGWAHVYKKAAAITRSAWRRRLRGSVARERSDEHSCCLWAAAKDTHDKRHAILF